MESSRKLLKFNTILAFFVGLVLSSLLTLSFNLIYQEKKNNHFSIKGTFSSLFFKPFSQKNLSSVYLISNYNLFSGNTFYSLKIPSLVKETLASSGDFQDKEIKEYIVQQGDTLSSIAQKFGIDVETILQANNLNSSRIYPGQKLVILPVSGVLHYVAKGETVSYLAKLYKVPPEKIIEFNNLDREGKIYIGDLLIIPGAKKSYSLALESNSQSLPSSFFICPLGSSCRVTQGLHWYNAVDLSNGSCGEPVFAAASGVVQRTGYSRVGGNYIRILHSLNIVTYYGHLSKILVYPGQRVYQGELIGYTGNTGFTIPAGSAGCHLHFDVRGAKNPFAK